MRNSKDKKRKRISINNQNIKNVDFSHFDILAETPYLRIYEIECDISINKNNLRIDTESSKNRYYIAIPKRSDWNTEGSDLNKDSLEYYSVNNGFVNAIVFRTWTKNKKDNIYLNEGR